MDEEKEQPPEIDYVKLNEAMAKAGKAFQEILMVAGDSLAKALRSGRASSLYRAVYDGDQNAIDAYISQMDEDSRRQARKAALVMAEELTKSIRVYRDGKKDEG